MNEIKAGSTFTLSCPQNSLPQLKAGTFLKQDKKNVFIVLETEGSKIELGPLEAGEFKFEIPCSGDQKATGELTVKALSQQEKGEQLAPLSPIALTYPLWPLLVLAAIIASIVGFMAYRSWKKSKSIPVIKQEDSPYEVLRKVLEGAVSMYRLKETSKVKAYYHQLIEALRKYLDDSFKTDTQFHTTRELVATIRPILARKKFTPELVANLEFVFHQSDQVRFAKYDPTEEERKNFISQCKAVVKHLEKQRVHSMTPPVAGTQKKGVSTKR